MDHTPTTPQAQAPPCCSWYGDIMALVTPQRHPHLKPDAATPYPASTVSASTLLHPLHYTHGFRRLEGLPSCLSLSPHGSPPPTPQVSAHPGWTGLLMLPWLLGSFLGVPTAPDQYPKLVSDPDPTRPGCPMQRQGLLQPTGLTGTCSVKG